MGLLLGGVLTEYLSWRWTLYVNLLFAGAAFIGGALLLQRQQSRVKPTLDIPGVLLPPRVVLDRNRSGACLSMLIVGAGLFGIFLFLSCYLQQTLGYSPLVTGVAFLPFSVGSAAASNLSTIVLMPRIGPKPLGASIGTSLLNTLFAGAVTSYLAAHLAAARIIGRQALTGLALAHGYDTAFWWTAAIFAAGVVIGGALLRPGPLRPVGTPSPARAEASPTRQEI